MERMRQTRRRKVWQTRIWLLLGCSRFGCLSIHQTPPIAKVGLNPRLVAQTKRRTKPTQKRSDQPSRTCPISERGLLEAFSYDALSTKELVKQIQQCGVDFVLTKEDEADLIEVGARPALTLPFASTTGVQWQPITPPLPATPKMAEQVPKL